MDELQLIKLWNRARWQVIVSQLAPTALLAFAVAVIPVVSVELVVSLIFLLILLASGILGAFAQYTASTEAQAIARDLASATYQSAISKQIIKISVWFNVVRFVTPAIFSAIFVAIAVALFS